MKGQDKVGLKRNQRRKPTGRADSSGLSKVAIFIQNPSNTTWTYPFPSFSNTQVQDDTDPALNRKLLVLLGDMSVPNAETLVGPGTENKLRKSSTLLAEAGHVST